MNYPNGGGTAAAPIEVFGVVGTPNLTREREGEEQVNVQLFNPEGPDPRELSFAIAAGKVVVFRWWKDAAEQTGRKHERYVFLHAALLDESCYARPDRQGGLRVLDPIRAANQAWTVEENRFSSAEDLYAAPPYTMKALLLERLIETADRNYLAMVGEGQISAPPHQ